MRPDTVTWYASLTSQPIFSMFCMCQNIAWKTFRSIYFDTVGWCLNFSDIRIVYTVAPSLTEIASCAYLPLLSCRRYALLPPCFNR